MAAATAHRGGRKQNTWDQVTFKEIEAYLKDKQLTQSAFSEKLGVTGSTFHNWKKNRCAPDPATQEKIRALLDGKKIPAPKPKAAKEPKKKADKKTAAKKGKKTAAKKTRAPRGSGSSTLAQLRTVEPGGPRRAVKKPGKKKVAAKSAKKKAKKTVKKSPARKKATRGRAAKAHSNGNDWVNVVVAGYLAHNPVKTIDDLTETVSAIRGALG